MIEAYYPETLKKAPVWALWRLEKDSKNRSTKVPYSPHYNGKASSTNPKTWGTFSQAVRKYKSRPGFYNGIAIVVSKDSGLIFIDIDHCIDSDGVLSDIALDIVKAFDDQFVEYSQSGTGVHIITKGKIPRSFKNSQNGVEIYDHARFCSLTGNILFRGEPTEKQHSIDYIFNKYKTSEKVKKAVRTENRALNMPDQWVVDHAAQHGKFMDLYQGDWSGLYGSQSEADLSLCIILAFWTDCNTDQMDRIFRSSGLYRDKWDRNDYRESTLECAVSRCNETFSEYTARMTRKGGEYLAKVLCEEWDRL